MAIQSGNKTLERYVIRGTVHGVNQSSQATYSEKHSVLAQGTYLSCSNEHKTSWWIENVDGTEKQLLIHEVIPLRDGHEVSAIYLGWRDADSIWPVAVFNATTKQFFRYSSEVIAKQVSLDGVRGGCLLFILGLLAVPVVPIVTSNFKMGLEGFGIGVAAFIGACVHNFRRNSRRVTQFDKDIQSEIHAALGWDKSVPEGVSSKVWTE